ADHQPKHRVQFAEQPRQDRTALEGVEKSVPPRQANLGRNAFNHSQLGNDWEREQLFKRFVGDSRPVVDRIICTSAFAMGLDLPNVRMAAS
ncbi:hypothetical protein ABTF76_20715, partial [Acinetobacter baumannii]